MYKHFIWWFQITNTGPCTVFLFHTVFQKSYCNIVNINTKTLFLKKKKKKTMGAQFSSDLWRWSEPTMPDQPKHPECAGLYWLVLLPLVHISLSSLIMTHDSSFAGVACKKVCLCPVSCPKIESKMVSTHSLQEHKSFDSRSRSCWF